MEMMASEQSARVLVVDDEQAVADLYATWLENSHDVVRGHDGDEALELVDDSIDVVFLDRQMPGLSGDDVLDVIHERGLDCHVVMVTAVDPGLDIVEMSFDGYLTKPVTREQLAETVDHMLTRGTYDAQMQEYFSLVSKKATLEAQNSPSKLAENDAYARITRRVDELSERVDSIATDSDSLERLLQELTGFS